MTLASVTSRLDRFMRAMSRWHPALRPDRLGASFGRRRARERVGRMGLDLEPILKRVCGSHIGGHLGAGGSVGS